MSNNNILSIVVDSFMAFLGLPRFVRARPENIGNLTVYI